jgi:hypothetical protein
MVAVPVAMPLTIPVEFTLAIVGLELSHTPPEVELVSAMEEPTQTDEKPEMGATGGSAFTVIALVVISVPHEEVTVYVIVTVPAATPVSTPVGLIVAMAVLTLHVPPVVLLKNATGLATQTEIAPLITPASGIAFTVTTLVATTVPQLPETE